MYHAPTNCLYQSVLQVACTKIAAGDALENIDTYVCRSTQHELTISQCVYT